MINTPPTRRLSDGGSVLAMANSSFPILILGQSTVVSIDLCASIYLAQKRVQLINSSCPIYSGHISDVAVFSIKRLVVTQPVVDSDANRF